MLANLAIERMAGQPLSRGRSAEPPSRPKESFGMDAPARFQRTTGLVDVLDRVLDKGLMVAGDVRVSLAQVELLTIRLRLLVCSIDKAEEIGLDWWKHDRYLSGGGRALPAETEALRRQIRALERKVAALSDGRRPRRRRRA